MEDNTNNCCHNNRNSNSNSSNINKPIEVLVPSIRKQKKKR